MRNILREHRVIIDLAFAGLFLYVLLLATFYISSLLKLKKT